MTVGNIFVSRFEEYQFHKQGSEKMLDLIGFVVLLIRWMVGKGGN
jgi:hypothetical protein